jgi:glycosyltransferase involved in cell wall biosynthesis
LISVIIPTLNEEKLLGNTLSQFTREIKERFNIEIIVSDGGSKDGTIQIAKEKADRTVVHNSDRRQTIAEGRNAGARVSEGNVLFFTNADTIIPNLSHFLEVILERLKDGKIVALTCSVLVFPEEQKWNDRLVLRWFNWHSRMLNVIGMGMGRGECQVVKREFFDLVEGYTASLAAGEDYNLFMKLMKHGRTEFVKGLVVYESPRRYRKFGYPRIVWSWFKNSLAMIFLHRSATQNWEEVR